MDSWAPYLPGADLYERNPAKGTRLVSGKHRIDSFSNSGTAWEEVSLSIRSIISEGEESCIDSWSPDLMIDPIDEGKDGAANHVWLYWLQQKKKRQGRGIFPVTVPSQLSDLISQDRVRDLDIHQPQGKKQMIRVHNRQKVPLWLRLPSTPD